MANYATSALKLYNTYVNTLPYNTCSTAAATAAKTVDAGSFSLETGAMVVVKFTVTNTAANPTLNVSSTGAKAIYYNGTTVTTSYLKANKIYQFVYNGTQWDLIGDINTDTNTNYYHTTGSWSGLTYTAKSNGGAGTLAFTIPTGTTSSTVAVGNHTHTTDDIDGGSETWIFDCGTSTTII